MDDNSPEMKDLNALELRIKHLESMAESQVMGIILEGQQTMSGTPKNARKIQEQSCSNNNNAGSSGIAGSATSTADWSGRIQNSLFRRRAHSRISPFEELLLPNLGQNNFLDRPPEALAENARPNESDYELVPTQEGDARNGLGTDTFSNDVVDVRRQCISLQKNFELLSRSVIPIPIIQKPKMLTSKEIKAEVKHENVEIFKNRHRQMELENTRLNCYAEQLKYVAHQVADSPGRRILTFPTGTGTLHKGLVVDTTDPDSLQKICNTIALQLDRKRKKVSFLDEQCEADASYQEELYNLAELHNEQVIHRELEQALAETRDNVAYWKSNNAEITKENAELLERVQVWKSEIAAAKARESVYVNQNQKLRETLFIMQLQQRALLQKVQLMGSFS